MRERLRAKVPPASLATRTLKIAMLGESAVDARVAPIYKRYPDVETTILAGAGEIELHFKTRAATLDAAQRRVDEVAGLVEDELDDAVYSRNGESLEQIVGYWLQMRNATVAVAESCTGGLLAERITSISGSSRYFLGGAVVYSNQLKTELAGVPAEMIDRHGAVSREVAAALAEGIRYRCESTLGVGITGVAGPGGGTPKNRGPGVPRRSQRQRNRSGPAQLPRRPQTHPPLRLHHGAGYGEKKVDVNVALSSQLLRFWALLYDHEFSHELFASRPSRQ